MRKVHPHQEIVGLSGLSIEDFWIWAYSDLLTNVTRNAFAEFMVGFALGRLHNARTEQTGFNYRDRCVEVKAASYVQSEPQRKKSKINFNIGLRKGEGKSDSTGRLVRPSDCYVFCLFTFETFTDKDAARNALLDSNNWVFYVVPTALLNEKVPRNKTLGVKWMDENCPGGAVKYPQLKQRIDEILGFPAS